MPHIGTQHTEKTQQLKRPEISLSILAAASRRVRAEERMAPTDRFLLRAGRELIDVNQLSETGRWDEIRFASRTGLFYNQADVSHIVATQIAEHWQEALLERETCLSAADLQDAAENFPILNELGALDRQRIARMGKVALDVIADEIERRDERRALVTGSKDWI